MWWAPTSMTKNHDRKWAFRPGRAGQAAAWHFILLLSFDETVCRNFIWRNNRRVWLAKTFGFIRFGEGIGSTHRGFLGTYSTNFRSKQHKLESREWLTKGEDTIYQRHYVSGKELHEVLWIWRTLSDDNPNMDPAIHNGADVSIDIQSEEEIMQRHRILGISDNSKA